MIRRGKETINCRITPLTCIHIGSGIELASYDYVIKNDNFYRIVFEDIFEKLSDEKREKLIEYLEESNIYKIRSYLKECYDEKYGYLYKASVSDNIKEKYNEKLAGARNQNEQNALSVFEFIGNFRGKYIPGSTIKGAIRSAFIGANFEGSYNVDRNSKIKTAPFVTSREEEIRIKNIEANILKLTKLEPKYDSFKNIYVTDTESFEDLIEITEVKRVGKKNVNLSMGNHEVIKGFFITGEEKNIDFKINIINYSEAEEIMKNISDGIVKGLKELYLDTDFKDALEEKAKRMIESDLEFFKAINNLDGIRACERLKEKMQELGENEVLIRFGKGAGFNSTTLNLFNKRKKEVFTRVLADEYPMGWAILSFED